MRELMARLGHASPAAAAAQRYQHAAERRDAVIADAVHAAIDAASHTGEPEGFSARWHRTNALR